MSDIKTVIANESHYSRIKILCTSRDVPSINMAFSPLIKYYRRLLIPPQVPKSDILKYLNGSAQDLVRMNPRWPWDVIFGHIADAAAGKFVIAAGILQKLRTSGVRHPDHIQQIINTVSAELLGTIDPVDAPRKEDELRRPTDVSPLTILLEILRRKEPQTPMAEVATSGTVEFMTELLRRNEYASIPLQLNSNMQDALNLLEFIIYLIDSDLLLQEGNRKARRLMIKLGNMANNIPKSLFLNASDIKADRQSWPFAQGGFADVYEGEFRGNRVALKIVRQEAIDQVFVREALTWRTLSHDYVLPFLGIYQDSAGSGVICLVSPFMENGTLHDWRHDKNPGVPEIEIRILQVAQGIQYLHREGVIHCDLRGSNVLLDYDFRVRIADFGLTRDTNATATANRSMSYRFAAPELFSGSDDMEEDDRIKRTEKTDVYAFGCLYYEVHFDCLPFGKGEDFYVINQIMHGRRPHRQTNPPLREEAWKLIETCWDQDPGKRPSMDDVVDTMISWSI
ncbi:kinase-like domain-containing protein [Amanita rubescens]|nr:kinase-like domain-containing protein [Amanita rubescens]